MAIVFVSTVFAQAPVITQQPLNSVKCVGSFNEIKILATGAEPMTYQWYKNRAPYAIGTNILTFMSASEADQGEY